MDHSVILISFFFNDCYVPLAQLVGSVSCKMTQVMMCIQFILEQQVLWKNVSCLRSEEFCGRRFPGVASKTTNFPAPPFQNQKTLRYRPWLPYDRDCLLQVKFRWLREFKSSKSLIARRLSCREVKDTAVQHKPSDQGRSWN